jgi:hypothetical protein
MNAARDPSAVSSWSASVPMQSTRPNGVAKRNVVTMARDSAIEIWRPHAKTLPVAIRELTNRSPLEPFRDAAKRATAYERLATKPFSEGPPPSGRAGGGGQHIFVASQTPIGGLRAERSEGYPWTVYRAADALAVFKTSSRLAGAGTSESRLPVPSGGHLSLMPLGVAVVFQKNAGVRIKECQDPFHKNGQQSGPHRNADWT